MGNLELQTQINDVGLLALARYHADFEEMIVLVLCETFHYCA